MINYGQFTDEEERAAVEAIIAERNALREEVAALKVELEAARHYYEFHPVTQRPPRDAEYLVLLPGYRREIAAWRGWDSEFVPVDAPPWAWAEMPLNPLFAPSSPDDTAEGELWR